MTTTQFLFEWFFDFCVCVFFFIATGADLVDSLVFRGLRLIRGAMWAWSMFNSVRQFYARWEVSSGWFGAVSNRFPPCRCSIHCAVVIPPQLFLSSTSHRRQRALHRRTNASRVLFCADHHRLRASPVFSRAQPPAAKKQTIRTLIAQYGTTVLVMYTAMSLANIGMIYLFLKAYALFFFFLLDLFVN